MFFRCFSLVFFFFFRSMRVGAKTTQSAEKAHCLNMLSSTRTCTHRTYSSRHTITHCFVSHPRECTHFLQRRKAQRIPLLPCFCAWIQSSFLCFFPFSQEKSMQSWSHCNVCVLVFLPNDENQCGRITRNIETTRSGLTRKETKLR